MKVLWNDINPPFNIYDVIFKASAKSKPTMTNVNKIMLQWELCDWEIEHVRMLPFHFFRLERNGNCLLAVLKCFFGNRSVIYNPLAKF